MVRLVDNSIMECLNQVHRNQTPKILWDCGVSDYGLSITSGFIIPREYRPWNNPRAWPVLAPKPQIKQKSIVREIICIADQTIIRLCMSLAINEYIDALLNDSGTHLWVHDHIESVEDGDKSLILCSKWVALMGTVLVNTDKERESWWVRGKGRRECEGKRRKGRETEWKRERVWEIRWGKNERMKGQSDSDMRWERGRGRQRLREKKTDSESECVKVREWA